MAILQYGLCITAIMYLKSCKLLTLVQNVPDGMTIHETIVVFGNNRSFNYRKYSNTKKT